MPTKYELKFLRGRDLARQWRIRNSPVTMLERREASRDASLVLENSETKKGHLIS